MVTNVVKGKMTMMACFLLGSVLAHGLITIIYRLHFHPLSRFPGPYLAAMTGLYEIYFSAWGTGSFDDEIERLHRLYGEATAIHVHGIIHADSPKGPVVRITPDEIHVQDQVYNASHADCWIKGTTALDSGRHQSGRTGQSYQMRKRSILQVEVHQIIRWLVQKYQVHKVFNSKIRPLFPTSNLPMIRIKTSEASDLEDGHQSDSLSRRSNPTPRLEETLYKGP